MASGHYWKGTNKFGHKQKKSKPKKSERMSVKVSFLCQKNRAKNLKMRLGKLV